MEEKKEVYFNLLGSFSYIPQDIFGSFEGEGVAVSKSRKKDTVGFTIPNCKLCKAYIVGRADRHILG